MKCKDCACSDVCYYKAFNDVRAVKKRNDVEKVCKSFIHRDSIKVDAVEVVHGRWVIEKRKTLSGNPYMDDNYHAHATCSECGFCIHSENASFGYPKLNTTNYCPNCGADMRGDANG